MPAPPTPNKKTGLTLLELLVASALLASIALMLAHAFATSARAVRRGGDELLLDEAARRVLGVLAADVGQALVRTNIPFRVSTVSVGDALYCASPGVRRVEETNPRDCAPIRVRSAQRVELVQSLNRRAVFEYASGATGANAEARRDLIAQSNFRRPARVATGGSMEFTEPLEELDGVANHAVLTFLDFRVNGRTDSNRSTDGLPTSADPPRFVDIILGLASAHDAREAARLHEARGAAAALAHLADREHVYARRVHLPNRGPEWSPPE